MRDERYVSDAWAWTIGRSENPSNKKRGRPYAEPRFQTVSLLSNTRAYRPALSRREHSQARSDDADRKDAQDDPNGLDALFVQGDAGKGCQQGQQTGEDRIEQILQDNLRTTHVKGQSSGQ